MPDLTGTFLLGRLTQEGRPPLALLAVTNGRTASLSGAQTLAVTEGLLWLAQSQLIGAPSVASVPFDRIGELTVRARRRRFPPASVLEVELVVDGRPLRFTARDDDAACADFLAAAEAQRPA